MASALSSPFRANLFRGRGMRRRIAVASVFTLVLLWLLGARPGWNAGAEDQPFVRFFLYEDVLEDFSAHCEVEDRYAAKGAEALWIEQLVVHPWRTLDPAEADLFVIPANFYAAERGWCQKTPEEFLLTTSRTLEGSDWFHRSAGRDHVILSTYFKSFSQIKRLPKFRNMIWLSRLSGERRPRGDPKARCRVAVMHNGPPPPLRRDRNVTHRHTLFFVGQVDTRKAYRHRVAAVKSLGDVDGGRGDNFIIGIKSQRDIKRQNDSNLDPEDPEKTFGIPYCEQGQSNGCYSAVMLGHERFMEELIGSRWNLFIGGDDPGSARFAEVSPSVCLSCSQHFMSSSSDSAHLVSRRPPWGFRASLSAPELRSFISVSRTASRGESSP
mmetsp:Transcript_12493/g.31613  ORF Transcript_12493/g.31613 Transcript_12493/m.31613 type:complete len:382 (+) Transcript_12493:139-1284(+)